MLRSLFISYLCLAVFRFFRAERERNFYYYFLLLLISSFPHVAANPEFPSGDRARLPSKENKQHTGGKKELKGLLFPRDVAGGMTGEVSCHLC